MGVETDQAHFGYCTLLKEVGLPRWAREMGALDGQVMGPES